MVERTEMSSFCEQVLPSCKWVTKNVSHVKINHDKITEYTDFILDKYKDSFITELSNDIHYVSDNKEDTLAYILVLDSINFGSGYFDLAKELGINLTYISVASSLKKLFENEEFNSAKEWAKVKEEYIFNFLSIPQGKHNKLNELINMFAISLRDIGQNIISKYNGKVENLIDSANSSAVKLVDIVSKWDSFKDVSFYKDKEIYILKRAQILAADINLVYKVFSDIEKLTIFSDNMIPHVLRADGILSYDDKLSQIIDKGEFITKDSEEELEIRASAIYIVELMKEYANKKNANITAVDFDRLLWHRGEEDSHFISGDFLCHRTLTNCY